MEREEFLKSLGIGLALVCTGTCFQACKKGGEDESEPNNNNGNNNGSANTVSANISNLAAIGSQQVINGVLFIRIAAGNINSSFVATEALCPHQGGNLSWKQASNDIQCDNHFAKFQASGAVKSGPTTGDPVRALKIYATTLNGTTLTATKS